MNIRSLCLALSLCAVPAVLSAQTATALKTGERQTGQTKQCYYQFAGTEYTKTVESYELCPLSIQVRTVASSPSPRSTSPSQSSGSVTAFKTGEDKTGQTKQCFYAFGSKKYTKTVQSYELCPLSIEVTP